MKVLVTGAAGFIGRHLVRDLLARGDEVTALDLARPEDDATLDGARWVAGDLGDADVVRDALAGCARVYHLAAAHLDQSTPPEEYRRVNVDAAVRLLDEALAAGVERFLHCSTVGVYGHVARPPAEEEGPYAPGNVYEQTKLEGEQAVLERARERDAPVVVVRPAWVYGPGCGRTARLLRMIRKGRFFYFGRGDTLRHPIHVDDFVAGMHGAVEKGGRGAVYNLAGPRALPLREMVATAAAALGVKAPRLKVPMWVGSVVGTACEAVFGLAGKAPPLSRRSLVFFKNVNSYSIAAAERDFGFRPQVPLDEGFRRCVAATDPK